MAPVPLEGNQTPVGGNMVQESSKGGSIALSMLIDFIIQRTYHELTVLAELLPRKTDMERKREIFDYASRTRQLFIRLMALVKWANSASKVDKSTQIMAFLDKQAMLFIDTADLAARIARETVVRARLPNFHIPAAVEVLTTGTYSRIPSCVKDRIIPSEPITPSERRSVLLRLNQVIQHRLVSSNLLPQMRNLKIENGRVTFHVHNEFEVSLTIMGDGPTMPWRLLHIDILVEDRETGEGKPLTHPLQVQYMLQILQARIAEAADPLKEVYSFLHFFCLSLQLEVYFSQTLKLCRDRLDGHISIDDYAAGKCLSISYWRELTTKDPKSELGYSLTLVVDCNRFDRPLTIVHVPSLGSMETEIMEEVTKTDNLSMEKLLVHTIYIRSKNRLIELKEEMKSKLKGIQCSIQGTPAILSISILTPCLPAEQLLVTVDTHTGMIQCHIPQFSRYPPSVVDLQNAFNTDRSKIPTLISDIRFWLTKQRCVKTLQHLPVTVSENLPLLIRPNHPAMQISKRKMFVTFHKHSKYILIVEMNEKVKIPCEMEYNFHLLHVKRSTLEEGLSNETSAESDIPKLYLKAMTLIQLDNFVMTHGPFTSVIDAIPNKYAGVKRKNTIMVESSNKKVKHPAYFIPELAHVVALFNKQIPFTQLAKELTKRGIPHQGIQTEANATALSLKLVQLPPPAEISITSLGWTALMKRLLSVSIRTITRGSGLAWTAEFVMHGTPVVNTNIHSREQVMRKPVYFQYEMSNSESISKMVDSLLEDWAQIVHLYCLVEDMAEYLRLGKFNLASIASVKSYNYNKLVISYGGQQRQATAAFQWNSNTKSFAILFGSIGNTPNAHSLLKEQLEDHLNRHKNLAQLIHVLHETYAPLVSINKLPSLPHFFNPSPDYLSFLVKQPKSLTPVITFVPVPQSTYVIRIIYMGTYCLEINLLSDGLVSIRDAAYSRFDRVAVVSDYHPTQTLKAFLSKYEDEKTAQRRRSQSEDDNPPSPIRTDSVDSPTSFLSHHRGPQSPIQREGGGLRFHPPMTPPSNPHTPASPMTGNISQANQPHQPFSSSPATSFSIASPPSLAPNINPSPSMLPHPSPGSSLLASSPSNPLHVPSPAGLMPTSSPGPCSSNIPVGHSPAGTFLAQGHTDGSPFSSGQNMASPAAANWPGSPGMPRPSPAARPVSQTSRILPQKPWAGAVPTVLSHEALDTLCTPMPGQPGLPGTDVCPLERFLGCVLLKKFLLKMIQTDDNMVTLLQSAEPGILQFRIHGLHYRVFLNQLHFQSLHMKITTTPESKEIWNAEDLQILERFFDMRIAAPPYRSNSIFTFVRIINCPVHPINILKDLIQILKLDLMPSLIQQQQMKWSVHLCLRVPPSAPPIVPVGATPFWMHKQKILFHLQVSRVGLAYNAAGDTPFLLLPIIYDIDHNTTGMANKNETPPSSNSFAAAIQHIKNFQSRFNDYNTSQQLNECSIFPTIRDLLTNFPSEQQSQMVSNATGHTSMMVPPMQTGSPMLHPSIMVPPQSQTGPQPGLSMNPPTGPMQGYPVSMANQMKPQHPMMGPQ